MSCEHKARIDETALTLHEAGIGAELDTRFMFGIIRGQTTWMNIHPTV